MKRVNIQNDVESRRQIATSTPKATVIINPETSLKNASSEESKAEPHIESQQEAQPQKRGRKTKGDAEEIPVWADTAGLHAQVWSPGRLQHHNEYDPESPFPRSIGRRHWDGM